ncbi:hypothetical protein A3Q56_07672, partial [Intoshia linei]
MTNWDANEEIGTRCHGKTDYQYAKKISNVLNIKLHHVNFVKKYWNTVFSWYFRELVEGYKNGLTPNPDILCNRYIKFGSLFNHAIEKMGVDFIATGHYAGNSCIKPNTNYRMQNERVADLLLPRDVVKDQTLFLSQIDQKSLKKTIFPLAFISKNNVKSMACDIGLEEIAKKPESMGVCFIGERNFSKFLLQYLDSKPGKFVDVDTGKILGCHDGTNFFTVGQRSHLKFNRSTYYIVQRIDKNCNDYY